MYTRKELVMVETTIYDFHTSFYIPVIQRLSFTVPYVRILGTHHCGELQCMTFKRRKLLQDVLYCRDYDERVVAKLCHQIQSEYYVGKRLVSIEGI